MKEKQNRKRFSNLLNKKEKLSVNRKKNSIKEYHY
jgi:hypothetical protein